MCKHFTSSSSCVFKDMFCCHCYVIFKVRVRVKDGVRVRIKDEITVRVNDVG